MKNKNHKDCRKSDHVLVQSLYYRQRKVAEEEVEKEGK